MTGLSLDGSNTCNILLMMNVTYIQNTNLFCVTYICHTFIGWEFNISNTYNVLLMMNVTYI